MKKSIIFFAVTLLSTISFPAFASTNDDDRKLEVSSPAVILVSSEVYSPASANGCQYELQQCAAGCYGVGFPDAERCMLQCRGDYECQSFCADGALAAEAECINNCNNPIDAPSCWA